MNTRFGAWMGAVALGALAVAGCKSDVQKTAPEFRGSRGESCLVTNDCEKGLLCVAQTCVAKDIPLTPTSKVCISAECIDNSDCCPPQTKSEAAQCQQLQDACTSGDTFSCDQHSQMCATCDSKCTDHQCVAKTTSGSSECTTDSDCGFADVYICDSGHCVECVKDSDCPTGNVCQANACIAGCTRDEQCGVMSKCSAGRCEARGCLSDYECAALLGVGDAICKDTKCTVACESDGQCAAMGSGGLSVCQKGQCVFVGCKENADCAALFAQENGSGSAGNGGNAGTGGNLALCVDAPK